MAAPSSGGGGRRADDDVSTAAVSLAAAAAPTTTTTTTPSKMSPLQRPAGGPRLTDTQVASADKSHRRKISLPWFRQTSTSTAAAALARQHTIDTPCSYRHRSTVARSSAAVQNSGVEITWVVADFTAAAAGQLTVAKGQQVELLDCCGGTSEMVLVRVPSDCTEGMVPHIVLKQPPSLKSPQATDKEN